MKKAPRKTKKTNRRKSTSSESRPKEPANREGGLAPAADRALRILEAFERIGEPLTLSRLAEEIAAPISSCHNLVRTLSSRGYLFSLDAQRAFYPTRKLWNMASSIGANDPVLQQVLPHAEKLRDATSETVLVGKRQEFNVLYLLALEGPQNIRYVSAPGRTMPLHTSAVGKALLSTMTDDELDEWLGARRLEKITPKSITDHHALREDINLGKTRGYFINSGENVADVSAIASLFRMNSDAFAIGVAGPTTRILDARAGILRELKATIVKFEGLRTARDGLQSRK